MTMPSSASASAAPTPTHTPPPGAAAALAAAPSRPKSTTGHRQHRRGRSHATAAPAAAAAATGANTTTAAAAAADPLSDRVTTSLIRRTLCPSTRDGPPPPIHEVLPPLTSSNDVDLQLYALLAIVLRDFVQSWYGRITTDEAFVAEIVHTIAHCSRAIEQRLRHVDLESLLLDEIPDLVDGHIRAYRASQDPAASDPVQVDRRQVYHALCPMPALSPVPCGDKAAEEEQRRNEAAYRQLLVQAVLAVLLPTEDLENDCLTTLVGQILSDLIIGNLVAGKLAQPWMLWEIIIIVARVVNQRRDAAAQQQKRAASAVVPGRDGPIHAFFLSLINLGILVYSSIRFLVRTIAASSSLPSRSAGLKSHRESPVESAAAPAATASSEKQQLAPVLDLRVWSMLASLVQLPARMPWLHGLLCLAQYAAVCGPGRVAGLDGPIDRLLSSQIRSALSPSMLPSTLRSIRGALFPNNAPGKSTLSPPATDDDLRALRRRAATALWDLLPTPVATVYLGGVGSLPSLLRRDTTSSTTASTSKDSPGPMLDQLDGLLDVLDDEYCNKHLVYGILELLLVRIVPELSEHGVQDLLDQRLG